MRRSGWTSREERMHEKGDQEPQPPGAEAGEIVQPGSGRPGHFPWHGPDLGTDPAGADHRRPDPGAGAVTMEGGEESEGSGEDHP